ncbi:hypothetical protein THAR02_10052 [Trichoderma harzianum]|uniref:Uncharacterized protein n=1 Tax=Trichoderma harzianum TaxID=5544 RepID=A0A0F9ZXC6_TRIHA|nr:hypothetical protein THAR02_10052 [Trichoderma harzianum]
MADMSDETWMGCTVQRKSDGGCIILSPDSTPLLETEDAPKTMSKKDNHSNTVDSIRDDEFAKFKLLARCTFLSDSCDEDDNTKTNASRSEKLSRLEQELKGTTVNGKTYVSAAYLGFSTEMKGAVFMRKELWSPYNSDNYSQLPSRKSTKGKRGPIEQLISGPVHEHATRFDLKGVSLKCGLSSLSPHIKHRGVIPHYLATTEVNLTTLKRLVSGEPLETFLTTPENRKAYDLYVEKLIQGLKRGAAIAPFSFTAPPVLSDLPPRSNLAGRLQDDAKPQDEDNRYLSEVACKPYVPLQAPSIASPSFVYRAAPVGAFEYPPELIRLLKEFALQYPNDFLPLRLMLLACHLWFDMIKHLNQQLQRSMSGELRGYTPYENIPEVSLAAFIVYFAHWLSWTESMGLSGHLHPFHFVFKACESDQVHPGFAVDKDHIPQDRIFALMHKVTSRIQNLRTDARINLLPCHIPGSKMPSFSPTVTLQPPHPISLALTGLPHVGYLGLPNYTRLKLDSQDRPLEELAKHPEKILRSHYLPYFVNSSLFGNLGTRLQTPSDLSKGVLTTFSQISPFWKPTALGDGSEPSLHPSALSSESTVIEPTESQAPRESLFYVPLLECWSKVPQQTHWAWKHGLQLLKDLPGEERQDETFKKLVSAAQTQHNQDISLINECLSSLYTHEGLSDYDLYIAVPTAFGRFIGLPPPQDRVVDAWTEHFLTIHEPSPQVKCISMILGHLRSAKANASSISYLRPLIQQTAQQLMGMSNSVETRDWLGSQWDFLFPQFTSTYNTTGDCP